MVLHRDVAQPTFQEALPCAEPLVSGPGAFANHPVPPWRLSHYLNMWERVHAHTGLQPYGQRQRFRFMNPNLGSSVSRAILLVLHDATRLAPRLPPG
jgi:hypothetical protein